MDVHAHIVEKFDVRVQDAPPFLGWYGSRRHSYPHTDIPRARLAELFADLGYKLGVEVGTNRGVNAETILKNNPQVTLICVDPYIGRKAETCYRDALQRLSPYGGAEFWRMTSTDALKKIVYKSIDFVYLDSVRDFNGVMMDLIGWGRRLKPGGMMSIRGYCHLFDTGVVAAVNAYTYAHNIRQWYITREEESNAFFIMPEVML